MKDRIPTYPGRMRLTDVLTGQARLYDVEMADEPTENGTAQNKALFDYAFAAIGTTAGTATAYTLAGDGGFSLTDGATIRARLHVDSGATPTINVNGTGAKALMADYYTPMDAEIKAGTWITATYCAAFDFFVLQGSGAKFKPVFQVFTANGTFNVANSGIYRITAIGKGDDGYGTSTSYDRKCDGGCGGAGYLETRLIIGESLAITISGGASVSKGGNVLISATAGGHTTGSSPQPLAGTASGTGVVAFPSNGTNTKDLTPPSGVYPASQISKGGDGGYAQSSRGGAFTQGGSQGGTGLYGGDGGSGGSGYAYSYSSYSYTGTINGATGGYGAGDGGAGLGLYESSGGTSYYSARGGSGGGGGFGGGGGKPWVYEDHYSGGYDYAYGGVGKGGAAAVIIERIA